MSDFNRMLKFVLRWEGGWVNNPHDRGGETNKGVTYSTYNSYRKSKQLPPRSVKLISDQEVEDIYAQRYFILPAINQLPWPVDFAVFDMAVNSGPNRAISTLQRVIGQKHPDGVIGSKTLNDLSYFVSKHSAEELAKRFNAERKALYYLWGVGSQKVFLKGWLNRLNVLEKEIDAPA